jgi:thioredoxin-like negative regulator of GroEL
MQGQPARGWLPILAVLGVIVLLGIIVYAKEQPVATTSELPETQLARLLAQGKPTLTFYHSNTCDQCIQMAKILQQVYPEFAGSVALVDVNVYDNRNTILLQKVRIRYIPTLIFYDRAGQAQTSVGVMEPTTLRQQLQALRGGQ